MSPAATNSTLLQSFGVDSLNQLTTLSRSGTMTVAGAVSTMPTSLTVKDNNNAAQAATVYSDNTFARSNITLLDGNNTFQAIAEDVLGRKDTNTVTSYLPSSISCQYDLRGNLTNDGRRVFFYDAENQLTNVLVPNSWKSEFIYDGFMRRSVRQEFTWSGSQWVQTNEVHYIYDGRLVAQERHYTPNGSTLIPLTVVTYTRGYDLSGTLEEAGGIGGLLARTDSSHLLSPNSYLPSPHAYYHADGNGNITALIGTNGLPLARYYYDPYGNILGMSGPVAEANLYRFSSKEWHVKSGLVYYLYRYYEPILQRWVNRDPIGEEAGMNLFEFVYSSPVLWIDSFGQQSCQQRQMLLKELGATDAQERAPKWRDEFTGTAEALVNLNPAVQAYTAATGEDAMGNPVGGGEQAMAAISVVPVGKGAGLLGKLFGKVKRLLRAKPSIPQKALDTLSHIRNYGKPPSGYVGGRSFSNREGLLPGRGKYREYDVDPKPTSGTRNAERLVIDESSGRAWYTDDHYKSFTECP